MIFKQFFLILMFATALTFSVSGYTAEENKTSHKVYEMPPHKIGSFIKSTKGQKRAIVLYASWCPSCVKKMPGIMDLERTKPGSVIAVSLDENQINFVRYIQKFDEIPFRIILNDGSEWKLAKNLKQFGIKPWESLPVIILIDENNKLVRQGSYTVDHIAEFLFSKEEI